METLERLLRAHRAEALRVAAKMSPSPEEAEDSVQDASIRAHQAWDRFDGRNFKPWYMRIVSNVCIAKYRQQSRVPSIASYGDTDWCVGPTEEAEPEMDWRIEEAVFSIPEPFRTTFILRELCELSYEEISLRTGSPTATLKTRLFRAKAHLERYAEASLHP